MVEVIVSPPTVTQIEVLEGQPGPKGEPGVGSAVAPLNLDQTTRAISLDQTALRLDATQIANLPNITTYVHTQNLVSSTWTITHNLHYYPQVVAQDSAGTTIEGSVSYDSLNQVTLTFSVALSGKAYLS